MRRWMTILVLLAGLMALPVEAAAPPHDFHVSITQIDYAPEAEALQITCKIFTEDLEATLEALGAPRLRLGAEAESPAADSLLGAYLQNRLIIQLDGKAVELRYLGKEVEFDATFCYLEVANSQRFSSITVINRILLEHFDDQANLTHVNLAGKTQSIMTRIGEESGQLKF